MSSVKSVIKYALGHIRCKLNHLEPSQNVYIGKGVNIVGGVSIKLNDDGEYFGQYYGMNLTQEDEIKEYFIDELWKMNDVPELADITQVMESLTPMNKKDVTSDSLICEFIGNGQFKY